MLGHLRFDSFLAVIPAKHRKSESSTRGGASITLSEISITEAKLATNVTVKGQVTLPKAVREGANIRPGDQVNVRVRPRRRGDHRGRGGCEDR